jgi:hypothetical protein
MFRRSSPLSSAVLMLAIALAGAQSAMALASAAPDAQGAGAQASGITVEWLGWSHVRMPFKTVPAPWSLQHQKGFRVTRGGF